MRSLVPQVAARTEVAPPVRIVVHRYRGRKPDAMRTVRPYEAQPRLILVQCPICGKRKMLRDEWMEEYLSRRAFACLFTDDCFGFLYTRHEFCIQDDHGTASTARSRSAVR